MSFIPILARGFSWFTARDFGRLDRALDDIATAEDRVVTQLVADLQNTERGHALQLSTNEDFFRRVPIVNYSALAADIKQQMTTGRPIVVPAPVSLYERTSGSSGQKKFIPYTPKLKRTFARMFRAWAHDVVRHGPKLRTGKFYFSISPAFDEPTSDKSLVRVGIDDDASYLDVFTRAFLSPFFVAPSGIAKERDATVFKDRTTMALLGERDLELVSVWSPTFFLVMLEHIRVHGDRLLHTMAKTATSRSGHRRIAFLRERVRDDTIFWADIWPELKVISAWRHGHAARPFADLARHFPNAFSQGKGLLATEGPVTIPSIHDGDDDALPFVTDVLIEVLDGDGRARRLSRCDDGTEGEVVISPVGGFARYRLGDRVLIVRTDRGSPRLRFLGRADRVSDLVGEKLEETFVDDVTARLFPNARTRTLVPTLAPHRYVLFVDDDDVPPESAATLDAALMEAFHYAHARKLGQLAAPKIVVDSLAAQRVLSLWEASGRRAGDLKPSALILVPLAIPLAASGDGCDDDGSASPPSSGS